MENDKNLFTELEKTILLYPNEEKNYMMGFNNTSKVDLILLLNNFSNKIEIDKKERIKLKSERLKILKDKENLEMQVESWANEFGYDVNEIIKA